MKHAPDSVYDWYLIETYLAVGEPSANRVRARPVAGQGLPWETKVECSSRMRNAHPVGTTFRVRAQVVENANGATFLYSHFSWPYEVVSPSERRHQEGKRLVSAYAV